MYFGADAKHHPARIGLLGLLADLGTGLEIVLHGLMKGFPKGVHGIGVKADPIADARDLAGEHAVIVVIVDTGRVPLVRHGVIPILSKNARAARI